MDEIQNSQMRRSISMPVKPLYLEPKTLKRSTEKETVYATDDSEAEDNTEANCLRQRSSPAMHCDNNTNSDNNTINETEATTLRGLPKYFRTVRESLANLVNPLFSLFRRSNSTPLNGNEIIKSDQDHTNSEHPKEQLYRLTPSIERKLNELDQNDENNEQNRSERVMFSL